MPSAPVHDAITFGLTVPVFGASLLVTNSYFAAFIVSSTFVFGGLMFGPDLDTVSRPYSRWGPVRGIWLPYRHFFAHRSKFSHGLIFGALLRVIYFLGAVTILFLLSALLYQLYAGGRFAGVDEIAKVWRRVGQYLGTDLLIIVFAGLWAGAASHTFTDMAGSFIKTGRSGKFF